MINCGTDDSILLTLNAELDVRQFLLTVVSLQLNCTSRVSHS